MEQQQFIKESRQTFSRYFDEDDDMRSFYLTSGGMVQFRKEIEPIAKMVIEDNEQNQIQH